MNGPKRLSDSGPPHLRALVEAGKRDAAGGRTEAAVLCALGLGATGGAALGAAAPVVARAGARFVLAKSLARLHSFASSKLGVGILAATVAGSASYVLGRAQERASTSSTVAERSSPDAPSVRRPDPVAPSVSTGEGFHGAPSSAPDGVGSASPAASTATSTATAPSLAVATPRRVASTARATNPALAGDARASARSVELGARLRADVSVKRPPQASRASIAAEAESIRRARTLVLKGDGSAALAELDAYEAQTPHRTFEEEDMALRVRALRLRGDRTGAARELAELQAHFPRSVHLASLAE
jgi:hypothetical protein